MLANPMDLVTLEEAQEALERTDDLSNKITWASRIIRELIGPVIHEEVTEYLDGGRRILILSHMPVVEGSLTLEDRKRGNQATGFFLDSDTGMVEGYWADGFRRWKATYLTGWAANTEDVPQMIKKAVFLLIENEISGGGGAAEGIKKESIGDYSVEYFGGEEAAAVSQDILQRIEPYLFPFKAVHI